MSLSSSLILQHFEVGIVVINIITDNVAIIVPYYRFCYHGQLFCYLSFFAKMSYNSYTVNTVIYQPNVIQVLFVLTYVPFTLAYCVQRLLFHRFHKESCTTVA